MQIISWMCAKNEYVEIPDDYFFDSEILSIYKSFQRQYFNNGSFNSILVKEDQQLLLAECMEMMTHPKPDSVILELKKYWRIRELYKIIGSVHNLVTENVDNIDEALELLNKRNTELLLSQTQHKYDHEQSVYNFTLKLEEAMKTGRTLRGYKSHLPDLDRIISGWETGKLYLLSGLEKLGKSRFTRNLFSTWLNDNHGCLACILEEQPEDYHECILAARTGINTDIMGTTNLSTQNMNRICTHSMNYMKQKLYVFNKSSMTPNDIRAIIRSQKIVFKKDGVDLLFVVVDYIQRMSIQGKYQKNEEMELIASELANIAKDENVCLIAVSQMGAGAEKSKGIPLHAQLRYGKTFKEAAGCIITFDDPERRGDSDNSSDMPDVKKIIANIIQRKGASNVNIDIRAQLQYSRFENYAF